MRNFVQPLQSTRCAHCDGELRFKLSEPGDPGLDLDVQIFVCAKCGREHSRTVVHDRYAAHSACGIPAATTEHAGRGRLA
jgi:DNA-directed RNA polymerase subunit RPC12/RpoP